jgi:hypothetical protein
MNRKKLVSVIALALVPLASGAGGSSRHDADVLVAIGAGVAGTWETEFEFANFENRNLSVFAGNNRTR